MPRQVGDSPTSSDRSTLNSSPEPAALPGKLMGAIPILVASGTPRGGAIHMRTLAHQAGLLAASLKPLRSMASSMTRDQADTPLAISWRNVSSLVRCACACQPLGGPGALDEAGFVIPVNIAPSRRRGWGGGVGTSFGVRLLQDRLVDARRQSTLHKRRFSTKLLSAALQRALWRKTRTYPSAAREHVSQPSGCCSRFRRPVAAARHPTSALIRLTERPGVQPPRSGASARRRTRHGVPKHISHALDRRPRRPATHTRHRQQSDPALWVF